jgi:hypothetical protein
MLKTKANDQFLLDISKVTNHIMLCFSQAMQTRNMDDYKSSQSTFHNEMSPKLAPVYQLTLC